MSKRAERRLYPRVDQKLPIKVAADGYDFATSTHNISCLGAYCHINKYIPPFTKVLVRLSFPAQYTRGNKDCTVACKGIIVRTEDETGGGFNIAIYFNQIGEAQKKKILQFISHFLPQSALN